MIISKSRVIVSVITPNYNSLKFIESAINSVINQDFKDWELLLIDDFSSDGSLDIIKKYSSIDNRIKYFLNNENLGASYSRNFGINQAKGRFIAFLDSDDLWRPDKLSKQLDFMLKKDISFSYTSYFILDENSNFKGSIKAPLKLSYQDLIKSNSIGCSTVMYDTFVFDKVSMPEIKKGQDYCCWLKLLKKTNFAYGLKEELAYYRKRNSSLSSSKLRAIYFQWKIYRDIENLNIFYALKYLFFYILIGFYKNYFKSSVFFK